MGIYTVNCQGCERPFQWFSGNVSAGQYCEECKKPKESSVKMEYKEVEYLNQIINLQKDLIEYLKAEVARLKSEPVYVPYNPLNPNPIIVPGYPPHNPFIVPNTTPSYPGINPLTPPYIVTCGQSGLSGVTSSSTLGMDAGVTDPKSK